MEIKPNTFGKPEELKPEELKPESVKEDKPVVKARPAHRAVAKKSKLDWGDMVFRTDYIMTNKAKKMKETLGSQELIKTLIPRDPRETSITFLRFNMNGLSFELLKGKFISVPKQVAEYISEMYMQDIALAENHELNLDNNKDAKQFLS